MNTTDERSGWLSWRFWLVSAAFWTLLEGVQVLAMLDFEQPVGTLLPHLLVRTGVYALATPLMFELAFRLVRRGVSGPRSALIYVAAVLTPAFLTMLAVAAVTGRPVQLGAWLLMIPGSMPFAAIQGVAVAANLHRQQRRRRRALVEAQLRALRSQLQPHFLFNTLQGIAATVRQDAEAAVRMIALLGDLLRQTLRERDGELVTLAEEHELLRPYLELQRLRFADRLTIEFDLPDDVLPGQVPDLLLQPLVENALLHGIERRPGAGIVVIRARRVGDRLELQVADDGAGPGDAGRDGVGLGSTRERLAALFGTTAELELAPAGVRGTVATVRLPWREARRAG